jgi:hypothetical protein
MAEVFAPFIINRTIRNLTFYCMEEGTLCVKKAPHQKEGALFSHNLKTPRHFAGLMAKASKIGSLVFNELT